MCSIRTLIIGDKSEIRKDTIIDIKGLRLSVIDTPSFCVYTGRNTNGYESFIFKYTNSIEETFTMSSASNQTLMTVGFHSGCIYTYQYKSEIGLSELAEMKEITLAKSDNVRFRNNVELQLRLLKQLCENLKVKNLNNN